MAKPSVGERIDAGLAAARNWLDWQAACGRKPSADTSRVADAGFRSGWLAACRWHDENGVPAPDRERAVTWPINGV